MEWQHIHIPNSFRCQKRPAEKLIIVRTPACPRCCWPKGRTTAVAPESEQAVSMECLVMGLYAHRLKNSPRGRQGSYCKLPAFLSHMLLLHETESFCGVLARSSKSSDRHHWLGPQSHAHMHMQWWYPHFWDDWVVSHYNHHNLLSKRLVFLS